MHAHAGRVCLRLRARAVPRGRPHTGRQGDRRRDGRREGEEAHPPGGRVGGPRRHHQEGAHPEDAVHPKSFRDEYLDVRVESELATSLSKSRGTVYRLGM